MAEEVTRMDAQGRGDEVVERELVEMVEDGKVELEKVMI